MDRIRRLEWTNVGSSWLVWSLCITRISDSPSTKYLCTYGLLCRYSVYLCMFKIIYYFSFTRNPAYKGKLGLRHFVPWSLTNFRDFAFWVEELNAALCLVVMKRVNLTHKHIHNQKNNVKFNLTTIDIINTRVTPKHKLTII